MGKKIYKEYIEYSCPNCSKKFGNRKDHYDTHIKKKKPCKKEISDSSQVAQSAHQELNISHIFLTNIEKNSIKEIVDIENKDKLFICEYCDKSFNKKFNLTRHSTTCKSKPIIPTIPSTYYDQELNEIKNQLKELKELKELKDENEKLKEIQLKKLKDENEKLKKQIKKNKSTIKNINSHNTNNNVNINIVNNNNIINFNDVDLSNVDKNLFVNPIMDRRLFGKAIILKMIENIYINENLPEYQNIVITDKNRGYVKVYNDGKWKTNNVETINLVLNSIIEHSKLILDELYEIYVNNNHATNRLKTSNKYIQYCDLEHLEELKDQHENEQVDNTHEIKRCEELREMVLSDTINLFHDNKNILLKPKNIKLLDI